MDYHTLEKMTVTHLREEAKKFDVKGVTAMKKEELIDFLVEKLGVEKPVRKHRAPKAGVPLDKKAIKKKLVALREERVKARAEADRKRAALLRRRIHSLKRLMRKIA